MSDAATAPLRVHRLTRLPDAFWQGVRETPWRYDLFQLLRRIDAQGGERYPLGRAPLPKFEPLRIGQQPSMSFAPSTLAQVRQREESGLHEVSILSFGLFGPNGPLPVHMTEYARERIYHHQDTSLSAFADLFHHRLALLFYRAWADAQPTVSLDRADNRRFEGYLASLIGMGQPGQMNKGSLSSHARFTHAGHLTRHGRDPE
ncbi:TPA: type VI secretion system baseplate subunit TssG, partial [Enterobacter asburiae]